MRWLFLIHRYLGIAIGVLMVVWCVSGVVMMYVRYPELSSAERLRHLQAMSWDDCCVVSDPSLADDARIDRFQVEMVAGTPVLRVRLLGGKTRVIDLREGQTISSFPAGEVADVAARFTREAGLSKRPRLEDFDRLRPVDGVGRVQQGATLVSLCVGRRSSDSTLRVRRLWQGGADHHGA